jgi:putative endonuclease
MKDYFVYIVRCSDGSYYTGITNNIERRISEHNTGVDSRCYTFGRRPVTLVFSAMFHDVNQAIRFEKQVKGWSRKKKEAMIAGRWDYLKILAVCKNASSHRFHEGRNEG